MRGTFATTDRKHNSRRGIAATEFAVCAPILVLLVLATMETASMIFLQQSLTIASYEATRIALVPGALDTNVKYQAELILTGRGVKNPTVTVTPSDIAGAAPGTWLNITSSAKYSDNALMGGWIFNGRTLSATVRMMKER